MMHSSDHPVVSSTAATNDPPQEPSYQELYARYLPLTMALPAERVEPCRASVEVAFVNARRGVRAALGTPEQIAYVKAHLPHIPVDDVLALPDLGRALIYASGKVVSYVASNGEIEDKLAAISGPREDMLFVAEVLARRGVFDKDRVAKIRAGKGKYDMAKDGVDLVGLYTEKAKEIAGQHPFTAEDFTKLRRDSEWLLEHLTPDGARAEVKAKSDAADVRDRLWTVMSERNRLLRKIGYYLFEEDFERQTPGLRARVATATAGSGAEEVAKPAGGGEEKETAAPSAPSPVVA